MELSRPLSRVTRHLVGAVSGAVEAYVHLPQESTRFRYIVVCEWEREPRKRIKASGVARGKFEAYLKAVVELGEVFLCDGTSMPNRTGVAGGLVLANAVERAKAELVERDAFLFHYRSQTPFVKRESTGPGGVLFEMSSPHDGDHCFVALDQASVDGTADCILMGFGCGKDRETAKDKALSELACMALDHSMRPGWCRDVYEGVVPPARMTDMHHAHSRDPRNKSRIRDLCLLEASKEALTSRAMIADDWIIEKLKSPLRYFKYVRVTHPGLAVLDFGRPEPQAAPCEAPLYHPVW